MKGYFVMIIDFHTHCFPDALAPRAIGKLADTVSVMNISPSTDGTASGLIRRMQEVGINRSVVCNIATNPHQMHKVNDFAISLSRHEELFPLGSLNPYAEGLEAELDRLISACITGIKIHPDYMQTDIDDPAFDNIFELCQAKNVFVITHAGLDPISPDHIYCTPQKICRVLDKFPKLKLVAAHLGGFHCEVEALEYLCGRDVYLDTSLISHRPDRCPLIHNIFKHHDPRRLLFATDTPWTKGEEEINAIANAPLHEDVKNMIFSENAIRLLSSCNYL